MAVQHDDLDVGLLFTVGLVGALITVAISYYASGLYHEAQREIHMGKNIEPLIELTREREVEQRNQMDADGPTLEEAKAAVVREITGR